MELRRLANKLGAEVKGVDLRKPLPEAELRDIRRAWNDHLVLLFRGQELSPEEHIAFSRNFGDLDRHEALPRYRHPDHPEIFMVTNRQVDGKPSATRNTGRQWHNDLSYTTRPATGALLHCRECPPVGGDTMFANMYEAFETLSSPMQRFLEPLWAVHDIMGSRDLRTRDPAQIAELRKINPPVAQPAVRIHPETGRKALNVHEMMCTHFVGMTREESQPILQFLHEHSTRHENVYRHMWRVDDLLLWDNRCTLHIALADYEHTSPRHMLRTTILGDKVGQVVGDDELAKIAWH
jgi:taurine dioxygenase